MSIVDAHSILFFYHLISEFNKGLHSTVQSRDMKKMMRKEKNKEQRMKMEQAIQEMKKAFSKMVLGI